MSEVVKQRRSIGGQSTAESEKAGDRRQETEWGWRTPDKRRRCVRETRHSLIKESAIWQDRKVIKMVKMITKVISVRR
jgi:hypothetical protein